MITHRSYGLNLVFSYISGTFIYIPVDKKCKQLMCNAFFFFASIMVFRHLNSVDKDHTAQIVWSELGLFMYIWYLFT